MRNSIIVALVLAATATPAAAQSTFADIDNLRIQQEAAARRSVALSNELGALESRLRTEQAVSDLRVQREGVRVPELPYVPATPRASSSGASPKYPSIPDAALADSNRRVQAASQPRR